MKLYEGISDHSIGQRDEKGTTSFDKTYCSENRGNSITIFVPFSEMN